MAKPGVKAGARRKTIVDGAVAYIPLTRGLVAIVDAIDADLGEFCWTAGKSTGSRGFNATRRGPRPEQKTLYLHRAVAARMGLDIENFSVDHRDMNALNNRRDNLREATAAQQAWNRPRRSDSKSRFKGVSLHKSGKWIARIGAGGKHRLGLFDTQEQAAAAYAEAAVKLYGEFARNDLH